MTGTPAATHSKPPATCNGFGVARMTPSGLSAANSSANDEYTGTEYFAAISAAAGERVDDGGQRRRRTRVDFLDVPLPDQPGAGDGDPQRTHVRTPGFCCWLMSASCSSYRPRIASE